MVDPFMFSFYVILQILITFSFTDANAEAITVAGAESQKTVRGLGTRINAGVLDTLIASSG